ncbi:MAG: Gfo/Idh/MocA family oxidoreductase [Clostridia bacterium]|nr:Gfo/Idh/MocA family oxidoreductase [Clostridia bacterium]
MANKPRIGIFGCGRGLSMGKYVGPAGGEIVAVCDHNPSKLENAKSVLAEGGKAYARFDDFIEHEMDGVYVANYFDQHVPYVIRLLEKGISVCIEPICGATMADMVALVRAAEKYRDRATFMFGENYQYTPALQEMKRIYQTGKLGQLLYAHCEYVHPTTSRERVLYAAGHNHWRNSLPSTYYNSHALSPLMYISDAMPKVVMAQSTHCEEYQKGTARGTDACGIMMTKMDNGAIFTTTGCVGGAVHSTWCQLTHFRGAMETVRYDPSVVAVRYTSATKPEDSPRYNTYIPDPPFDGQKSAGSGHGGGDYFVVREFIRCLEEGIQPYNDVYRGVAMAAVGVLGWRSVMEGGMPYAIPDFRDEAELVKWENDTLSPFIGADGKRTLPTTVKQDWKADPADLAAAEEIWKEAKSFTDYSWPGKELN